MITNGQMLADKAFFKRCVDAGLTHIHVSLHSYRREVHDFITQYRGAWDVLVQCLEQRARDGHHLRHQHGDQRLQLRSPARERAVDLRELPVHPPLRLEQHGSGRQSRRRASRLHSAALRVPGARSRRRWSISSAPAAASAPSACRCATCGASPGPRPKRARSSRKKSAAFASSTSRASSTRRSSCTARARVRRLPLRSDLRRHVLDGEDLRRARAVADLRRSDRRDRRRAGTRTVARAAVAAPQPTRSALEDRTTVAREDDSRRCSGRCSPCHAFCSSTRRSSSTTTSSTTRTSPITGCSRAPGWRRGPAPQVEVYDAFALPASGRHRRADGGFVLGVEHDDVRRRAAGG